MGQKYSEISDKLKRFIDAQKMYFVGTAAAGGRINISPKGMDSLRVVDKNRVIWLNVTGSGNETSVHVQENPRMTIMFIAFEGNPLILRLYGDAKAIHKNDVEWNNLISLFSPIPGARQIFDLSVDLAHTSCGMGVPFFDHVSERDQLEKWATKKEQDGLKKYWQEKNQISLDGKPSNIMQKNT